MNSKLQIDFRNPAFVGIAEPWYITDASDFRWVDLKLTQLLLEKVHSH